MYPFSCFLFFSSNVRMKFDMANGTMNGEDTTCKKNDDHCIHLYSYHHDRTKADSRYLTRLNFHSAPKYGEWADLTATITFPARELVADNVYLTLLLYFVGKFSFVRLLVWFLTFFNIRYSPLWIFLNLIK